MVRLKEHTIDGFTFFETEYPVSQSSLTKLINSSNRYMIVSQSHLRSFASNSPELAAFLGGNEYWDSRWDYDPGRTKLAILVNRSVDLWRIRDLLSGRRRQREAQNLTNRVERLADLPAGRAIDPGIYIGETIAPEPITFTRHISVDANRQQDIIARSIEATWDMLAQELRFVPPSNACAEHYLSSEQDIPYRPVQPLVWDEVETRNVRTSTILDESFMQIAAELSVAMDSATGSWSTEWSSVLAST